MPRSTEFEPAKKNYRTVKYFPFPVEPGASYMLTSNPWDFLRTWLSNEIQAIKKEPARKKRLTKSLYFLDLAESFNTAAKQAKLPVRGTFYYYSILNLIKVYLLHEGMDLETTMEHHGLAVQSNETVRLKILPNKDNSINLFHEFADKIGCGVSAGNYIELDEMISEIPEIHEMAFSVNKLKTAKRKFLPVDVKILVNARRNKLVYEISFTKKDEQPVESRRFQSGILKDKLKPVDKGDGRITYRSAQSWSFTHSSDTSWRGRYRKIQKELEEIGIAVILTRSGYRYYLNLQPGANKPIVCFVALTYYIGSIARYRPTVYQEILSGEYQAILNETMETCPQQFLYYITSHITQKVCAVPMSKLN